MHSCRIPCSVTIIIRIHYYNNNIQYTSSPPFERPPGERPHFISDHFCLALIHAVLYIPLICSYERPPLSKDYLCIGPMVPSLKRDTTVCIYYEIFIV